MAANTVITKTFKSRPMDERLIAQIKRRIDSPSDSDTIRKALRHYAIHLGILQER